MATCVRCKRQFAGRALECRAHVGNSVGGVWSCCGADDRCTGAEGCVRAQHTTCVHKRTAGTDTSCFVKKVEWDVARFGLPTRLSVYRELGIWEEGRWVWCETETEKKQAWRCTPRRRRRSTEHDGADGDNYVAAPEELLLVTTSDEHGVADRRVLSTTDRTEAPMSLTSGCRKRKRLERGQLLVNELDVRAVRDERTAA
ncbi:MAG: hypothetical protein CMI16_16010 [Opitutaceae bacterium]|nr:hypothetical protein [Opitutaceae bacterium]